MRWLSQTSTILSPVASWPVLPVGLSLMTFFIKIPVRVSPLSPYLSSDLPRLRPPVRSTLPPTIAMPRAWFDSLQTSTSRCGPQNLPVLAGTGGTSSWLIDNVVSAQFLWLCLFLTSFLIRVRNCCSPLAMLWGFTGSISISTELSSSPSGSSGLKSV